MYYYYYYSNLSSLNALNVFIVWDRFGTKEKRDYWMYTYGKVNWSTMWLSSNDVCTHMNVTSCLLFFLTALMLMWTNVKTIEPFDAWFRINNSSWAAPFFRHCMQTPSPCLICVSSGWLNTCNQLNRTDFAIRSSTYSLLQHHFNRLLGSASIALVGPSSKMELLFPWNTA